MVCEDETDEEDICVGAERVFTTTYLTSYFIECPIRQCAVVVVLSIRYCHRIEVAAAWNEIDNSVALRISCLDFNILQHSPLVDKNINVWFRGINRLL